MDKFDFIQFKISIQNTSNLLMFRNHYPIYLGAFVPLTKEGVIVVDGVLASWYGSFDHDVAHLAMTPIQWFPDILEWIFGEENGSSGYVDIAIGFGRMKAPFTQLYENSNI